ncbi:Hypothetical protein CINCED_3A023626, partial [Cinara cedri]
TGYSKGDEKKNIGMGRYLWRKPDAMTKTVLQEYPRGDRPLGRPGMRWEDCVKKDVTVFYPRKIGIY